MMLKLAWQSKYAELIIISFHFKVKYCPEECYATEPEMGAMIKIYS